MNNWNSMDYMIKVVDEMIKVVDEYRGIVVATLDPTWINMELFHEVIESLQRAYGCELTTFYPGE